MDLVFGAGDQHHTGLTSSWNFDPNQALTEVLAKVNSVKYLIPKESNDSDRDQDDRSRPRR